MIWLLFVPASTCSRRTSDRPSGHGRCGVRVPNSPTGSPSRGGVTLAFTAAEPVARPKLVFSWNANMSQTWLYPVFPLGASLEASYNSECLCNDAVTIG